MSTKKKPAAPAAGGKVEAPTGPAPKPVVFLEFGFLAPASAAASVNVASAGGRSRPGTESKSEHSRRPSAISKDGLASHDGETDGLPQNAYRFEFELAADTLPRTCENFRQFVMGTAMIGDKKNARAAGYKNTRVLRCSSWFVQGGDVANREDGRGQECIYGASTFDDEHLGAIPHRIGVLSMANSGPNTNGSQFGVITSRNVAEYSHMDTRYQAFATLLGGTEAEDRLEEFHGVVAALATDAHGTVPAGTMAIINCGVVEPQARPTPTQAP